MKHKTMLVKTMSMLAMITLFVSCKKNDHSVISPVDGNKYQRIVDRYLAEGAKGVSVTVISSQGVWTGVGGKADVENNVAMTPAHTFHIGSMTKMFASATILKLQDEGILNIRDKINKYIPRSITDRIANANDVTIEQCLNHTSGIPNYVDFAVEGLLSRTVVNYSAERNLEFIYGQPALFPPGTSGAYSNSNYLLISSVINHATGKPAYQSVMEKIVAPLQLQNTFPGSSIPNTLSKCYFKQDDSEPEMQDVTYVDNNAMGGEGMLDGGIISTSQDVAHFLQALVTGRILTQASLAQMENFLPIPREALPEDQLFYKGYGLGFINAETDHGTAYGHDGRVYGFQGKAFYFPAQKLTVSILLNSDVPDGELDKVVDGKEIFNLLF